MKSYIDEKLEPFRFRLLLPISAIFAVLMTLGVVYSFWDGSIRLFLYLPVLSAVGSWASFGVTLGYRRVSHGFILLTASLLTVLVFFPIVSPEPFAVYQGYLPFIYSLFIILIVLSGLFGLPIVAKIGAVLFVLQFAVLYGFFNPEATWRMVFSSNYMLLLISAVIISFIVVRQHALLGRMIQELLQTNTEKEELAELSITDPLTGLFNRRYIETYISNECDRISRYGGALSCLMIDADRFKQVNDVHGHQTGDDVLRSIAGIIKAGSRQSDVCARYGGEEFMVLTPADAEGAAVLAERIRKSVATTRFSSNGSSLQVTISIGVAAFSSDPEVSDNMLNRADAALYRAKVAGRNRTVVDRSI